MNTQQTSGIINNSTAKKIINTLSKKNILNHTEDLLRKPKPAHTERLTGSETPAELLKLAEISQDEDIIQEPICIEVGLNDNWSVLGTIGNFSLIIGKAKSRKTFFHSFFLGAWINDGVLNGIFKATAPKEQPICIYFDTEQSRFHVQKVVKRVLRMVRQNKSEKFIGYNLRRYNHLQRIEVIEEAIYNTVGLGLVVIDGIRDLVSDINNSDEASQIAGKLLKWSEEKNIHIVTILHQNKGNNDARGHLGTELQNKAETTISVTKEGEISLVAPEYCRDKDFEPFAFGVDLDGLPCPVDYVKGDKSQTNSRPLPSNIADDVFRNAINIAFKNNNKQRYKELVINLKLAFEGLTIVMGDNKAKDFIQDAINKKYLMTEGTPNTKAFYYSKNILD